MTKKISWKSQFPTFYRIIPEVKKALKHAKTKLFWTSAISFVFLLLIIFELGKGYELFSKRQQLELQRQQISSEIEFWNQKTKDYKSFKDAYYKIALLEYQLGNSQIAKAYVKKALSIDPFFEEAKKLEKILK